MRTGDRATPTFDTHLRDRYAGGHTFAEFLASTEKLREFWHTMARRARVEPEAVERVAQAGGSWHLLALSADWCGDSANTIPYIARLADEAPNLELRVLERDSNRDLVEAYHAEGTRSIPRIVILDGAFRECGVWGPRPAELQQWVREHGLALPTEERYRHLRSWYARDHGRTAVAEVTTLIETCPGTGGT